MQVLKCGRESKPLVVSPRFIRKSVPAAFQRAEERAGGWLEHGGNNQRSPAAALSLRSPEAPGNTQNRIKESLSFEKTFKIIKSS